MKTQEQIESEIRLLQKELASMQVPKWEDDCHTGGGCRADILTISDEIQVMAVEHLSASSPLPESKVDICISNQEGASFSFTLPWGGYLMFRDTIHCLNH